MGVRSVVVPKVQNAAASTRRVVRKVAARPDFPLLCAWYAIGVLAVVVPLVIRTRRMNQYQMYAYNWRDQQDYRYSADGYDMNNCKWYQFMCQTYYYGNGGQQAEGERPEYWSPSWYSGWGTTEKERQRQAMYGNASETLKWAYMWQIFLFAAILVFGNYVIVKKLPRVGLVMILLIWANMSWLSMWFLAGGAITTKQENFGRNGFYGQMSVLIFMTNFWFSMFGVGFAIVVGLIRPQEADQHVVMEERIMIPDQSSAEYQAYKAPIAGAFSTIRCLANLNLRIPI